MRVEPSDFTYECLNRRTVSDIEKRVVKQGKRKAFSRFIVAKGDKDKIAAWKQDLIRVLQVFNVRSICSVGYS
jgi:hypothetical protein